MKTRRQGKQGKQSKKTRSKKTKRMQRQKGGASFYRKSIPGVSRNAIYANPMKWDDSKIETA
jgi:hypothetical protein